MGVFGGRLVSDTLSFPLRKLFRYVRCKIISFKIGARDGHYQRTAARFEWIILFGELELFETHF